MGPTTPLTARLSRRAFLDRGLKASLALGGGLSAAALLDACGAPSASGQTTPPPGAKVIHTLLFDQVGYDPSVLQQLATRFQQQQNNKVFVSLETAHYQQLYESILAAGLTHPSPYDVVALDQVWVPELASRKQLLSLTGRLDDESRADLMPSLLDAFSYRSTLWAMPQVLNVQSLYYNRQQLKNAGFSNPPATLEEWHAQMRRLKSLQQMPYIDSWAEGEGLVSDFVRLTAQFGGDLFDVSGRPLLQQGPALKAAAFMRALIDEQLVAPSIAGTNEPDAMRAFLNGSVSYKTNWNFVFGAMNDPVYSKIIGQGAVAVIPASADVGKPAASVNGFLGLGVLSGTEEPDLAFSWVRYLTSAEVQAQQLTQIPIWTSLQTAPAFLNANPSMNVFLANLANSRPRPQLTHYTDVSAILQQHLHDLVVGAASPAQAMAAAQTELTALLNRLGN